MDTVQAVDGVFCTIDGQGFLRGTIRSELVNDLNRHNVVEEPLPSDTLGAFEKWRWVGAAWEKHQDLRGHSWYDPLDTDRVHSPQAFDDAPPPGWTYWEPGENPAQTQAEIARKQWASVRTQRNRLLSKSDWTALPDVPLSEERRQQWQAYRQALRDVTEQNDPFNIVWPTPPG